jgi:hypothetical protein
MLLSPTVASGYTVGPPGRSRPGTFGEGLGRARVEARLTQEKLAARSGLSVRGIRNLQAGVTGRPSAATAMVEEFEMAQLMTADARLDRDIRYRLHDMVRLCLGTPGMRNTGGLNCRSSAGPESGPAFYVETGSGTESRPDEREGGATVRGTKEA